MSPLPNTLLIGKIAIGEMYKLNSAAPIIIITVDIFGKDGIKSPYVIHENINIPIKNQIIISKKYQLKTYKSEWAKNPNKPRP